MLNDGTAHLLDAIYASAALPSAWPTLLELLAVRFRATFVDRYRRTHDCSEYSGFAWGMEAAEYQSVFLDTWVNRNVWSRIRPVRVAGEVVSTRQMVPKDALIRSEMYNDFLGPRGLHEGLRLSTWSGPAGIECISLLRPWTAGPFEAEEIAFGMMILPHLQRSVAIGRRLQQADDLTAAGLAGLDLLPHAIFLLTETGRALHLNRAAERLLADADGLVSRPGGLAAATPGHTADLLAMLSRAGQRDRPLTGALRLPRPSGRPALALIAIPVSPPGRGADPALDPGLMGDTSARPAVLLCITDPDRETPPNQRHLAALFGLTSAEAALAADLLAGHDLAEIANLRGRSIHTVRTHLQRIMAKTETTRQSDLMRTLLRVPSIAGMGPGLLDR